MISVQVELGKITADTEMYVKKVWANVWRVIL